MIVARVFTSQNINSSTNPQDNTPADLEGHGTDVSSIASSVLTNSPLGPLSGMAPGAYLGNYKIFTAGLADSGQVIAALEQAVLDGAQIVNMSLGSLVFSDPQHDPQVLAVQNAIDMGVTVVIAAGNAGEGYFIGNPQQVNDAITVGASTNSHDHNGQTDPSQLLLTATADGQVILRNQPAIFSVNGDLYTEPYLGAFPLHDVDLVDGGGYGGPLDGRLCDELPKGVTLQDWVLVQRGECTFTDKINRAMRAGAQGILFFSTPDNFENTLPTVEGTSLPSVMISNANGLALKQALLNHTNVTITLSGQDRPITPNLVASFSSQGPSVDYSLKPDVTAPGQGSFGATQNDFSGQPYFELVGFNWFSGTSMSSPRIAGLAALVKQVHPDWPPAWIKSAILLTASRVLRNSNDNRPARLLEQGMGLAQAASALSVDTLAVPALLGFGAQTSFENVTETRELQVINVSDVPCDYILAESSSTRGLKATPSLSAFSLEPQGTIDLSVTLQTDSGLAAGMYEGQLLLTNVTQGTSSSLVYGVLIQQQLAPQGRLILIDDDEGANFEAYYIARLNELGILFTYWDVKQKGGYPTFNYLKAFPTVLWFMSQKSLNSVPDENSVEYARLNNPQHLYETTMSRYLAEGGTLFLSGMDYFDDQEVTAFSQAILLSSRKGWDVGAQTIAGVSANPVGSGIGSAALTFPQDFNDYTDEIQSLNLGVTQPAFSSNGNPTRTVGVTVDACNYRAIFLAFPLEVTGAETGRMILDHGLRWLGEPNNFVVPQLQEVTPATVSASARTLSTSLSITGQGFTVRTGYRAYLDQVTLQNIRRTSCNRILATLPANTPPGTYTLRLVTGDGHELRLVNAVRVESESNTSVEDWRRHDVDPDVDPAVPTSISSP